MAKAKKAQMSLEMIIGLLILLVVAVVVIEELCDSPEVVRVAGKTNDNDVEKVFFQDCTPYREDHSYSDTDWLRFRIVLKDSKYNIPSMSKDLKNLVWKIQGAIIIDYNQCPIEWTVNIDPCSGGSNELPGGVTPEPPPY
ncbi:MAG: hypothetical protein COZ04_01225 [Candidatus Aenigmarchaeota archaeon CG_4_10_14_3_um_filter_37_21]|nr:MAG: hypothetical protein COZ04_01225 [Candidatus Aenigmarchaeota archaeon CG_4_10_14_3_um_filter_37_21]